MFKCKKILVPTDFSENAKAAYNPAQQLASQYGAMIDFIHVIPTAQYFEESMEKLGPPLDMEKDLYPKIHEQSEKQLEELMDEFIKAENRGKGIVTIGPKPSREIVDYADKGGYDLILMATNGHHETEFLKGSITEKVIRHANTPLLTLDTGSLEHLKKILIPTDGSQLSFEALPLAISLARGFNAELILFHVLELYGSLSENAAKNPMKSDMENIRDFLYKELEAFLGRSYDDVTLRRGDGFQSQLVCYEGASSTTINMETVIEKKISAHYGINDYAVEHADMVVMATHGRSGLAHLFLGSTTEKVAQHLDLPVITIKPDLK